MNQATPIAAPTLDDFRDLHRGQKVIVCGCGASLRDFQPPRGVITIGVNDVGRAFDPDYLVVLNAPDQFAPDRFAHVAQCRARAVFSHLDLTLAAPLVRFRLGDFGGTGAPPPGMLHYTRNSPFLAVHLAAFMGATEIGLIGVDFTDDHFFGATGAHVLTPHLAQIDAEFRRLAAALEARGIRLTNLSPQSRLSLHRARVEDFAATRSLSILSYATTPVAGVPEILARAIDADTPHRATCLWSSGDYGNGVRFEGGVSWRDDPRAAATLLEGADLIIAHNGRIDPAHVPLVTETPVITMAHNYGWNVDMAKLQAGGQGAVVGQYQAGLPEFAGWAVVPNPMPTPPALPEKPARLTIAFTPSGWHERYPDGHRLYWHAKGAETTGRTLARLAERYDIEVLTTQNGQVSHAEALAMKARAHIVIDEVATGSYHRNSLEGLAAGAVTVNGLGQFPPAEAAFRHCAGLGETDPLPFQTATLETLEAVLEDLVVLGPEALAAHGAKNHAWMTRHWNFAAQWQRLWQPVIDRALGDTAPAPRPASKKAESTARHTTVDGATVVVPFGGMERLALLDRTLLSLRSQPGVAEIIVAELGTKPVATATAEAHGASHLFAASDPPFHKARAMNLGAAAARQDFILWHDADLVLPPNFVAAARVEAQQRQLDCLVPWTEVAYLSEDDTNPVLAGAEVSHTQQPIGIVRTAEGAVGGCVLIRRSFFQREGGVPDQFRGWGGEDNAWFWKARVLGRAGMTERGPQRIHHLYHPLSGGYGGDAHQRANPHYAANVKALDTLRRCGTSADYLARYPRPTTPPTVLDAPCTLSGPDRDFLHALAEALGCFTNQAPQVETGKTEYTVSIPDCSIRFRLDGPGQATLHLPEADRHITAEPDTLVAELAWHLLGPLSRGAAAASDTSTIPEEAATMTKLNLGCCDRLLPGYVNVDIHPAPGVEVADLSKPWPWEDSSVAEIIAHDVIEHLPDKILTMNEMHRVLRAGGEAEIIVPTTDGPGAFQDPTHVSFWHRRSFLYYEVGNPYRERFAESYGITARFRVVSESEEMTTDGPKLTIRLAAVK